MVLFHFHYPTYFVLVVLSADVVYTLKYVVIPLVLRLDTLVIDVSYHLFVTHQLFVVAYASFLVCSSTLFLLLLQKLVEITLFLL